MGRLQRRLRVHRPAGFGPARAAAEHLEPRRLLTAGRLDGTFGNGGTVVTTFSQGYGAVDAALQPDGKILAVGAAVPGYELRDGFQLLRYDAAGSLDPTFGVGGRAPAPPTMAGWTPMDMALAPDGDIVISGAFVHLRLGQPDQDFVVTRFHADGSLDTGFGTNGVVLRDWGEFSRAYAVAVQPDGKILAAGWTTWSGDQLSVLRFNPDGTTDTSFGNGGIAQTEPSGLGWPALTYSMALAPGGKILVGGYASDPARNSGAAVARFNADGSLDTSFNGTGSVILSDVPHEVQELYAYGDGRVLMAGEELLARRLANGQPDPTFSPNGRRAGLYGSAMGMDVGSDGTILATSYFENFTTFRFSDGGTWLDYVTTQIPGGTTATWDRAAAVVIQPDSKFIAVGSANGGTSFGLARYQGTQSPPEVSRAEFVLSPRAEIRFVFSEPVGGLDLDDLQVINTATGARLDPTKLFMNASSTGGGFNDATWVPVDPLPGGSYRAVLPAGSVTNGNGIGIQRFELPFTVPGGDVTPPLVNRYFYVDTPSQEIHFEFTEDVLDSLDLDDLIVTDRATGQRVSPGAFFLNARGGPNFPTEAVWVPADGLPAGNYQAALPAGSVADKSGNALPQDFAFLFTAGDPAPYVISARYSTAYDGAQKQIDLQFSEGLDETTVGSNDLIVTDRATGQRMRGVDLLGWTGGVGGTVRATWGGQYILPTGDYRAVLPAASVRDLSGQTMASDFGLDFSVGPQADETKPLVARAAYYDWPAPQQRLRFEFNEDVIGGLDLGALTVTNLDTGQALPAGAVRFRTWGSVTAGTAMVEWQVDPLAAGRYRATLPAGAARDQYGNPLASDGVLDFTVAGPGDHTPPAVARVSSQPTPPQVTVSFTEDVFASIDRAGFRVVDLATLEPVTDFGLNYSGAADSPTELRWYTDRALAPHTYRLTILAGNIADPAGNVMAGDFTYDFTLPKTDFTPPQVTGKLFDPGFGGGPPYLQYRFDEDVSRSIQPSDLVLTNTTTGQRVDPAGFNVYLDYASGLQTIAQWTVVGGLAPGDYTATLNRAGITDPSANALGTPDAGLLTFRVTAPAAVVGRFLFYNGSALDGGDLLPGAADDAAIATDKRALLPGQSLAFANVSSYSRGITGVMIDVAGLPAFGARGLIASDFAFSPGVPPPARVAVRRGAGAGGSDRVSLTWGAGAIRNQWLGVRMLANAVTGLAAPDAFWFGSLVGETGDGGAAVSSRPRVTAADLVGVLRTMNSSSGITGRFDFDRDGRVTARDLAAVRGNITASLGRAPTAIPAAVPAAAPAGPPAAAATDLLRNES